MESERRGRAKVVGIVGKVGGLFGTDAPQGFVSADDELVVGGNEGGIGGFADVGLGEDFEFLGVGFEDDGLACLAKGVDGVASEDEGAPGFGGAGEAVFPEGFAGLDVEAEGNAAGVVVVVEAVFDDAGADAAVVADFLPEAGWGDISGAAGFDGDGVAVVAAKSDDDALIDHGGGVDEGVEAGAGPEDLAGDGVEGFEFHGEAHDEFGATVGGSDDGGAEGADDAFALAFESVGAFAGIPVGFVPGPDGFACSFVEGGEEGAFAGAVVVDAEVAVEDGGGGVAPFVGDGAEVAVPELFAVEVVGDESGGTEGGDDDLAVGGGGGGAVGVGAVGGFGLVIGEAVFPEELAVETIEAHDATPVGFGEGLSDEDAVTMDDGGGVARFGEFDTPDDIFVRGPGGRECGVLGVTGALEVTAPGGPIGVSDRSEG